MTLLSTFPKQTEQAYKKKRGGEVEVAVKLDEKGEVTEAKSDTPTGVRSDRTSRLRGKELVGLCARF